MVTFAKTSSISVTCYQAIGKSLVCFVCSVLVSVSVWCVRSRWVMMGHRQPLPSQPSESLSKPLLSINLCVRVERVRRSWNRDICRNTSAIITPALWSDALYLQWLSSASPFSSIFSPPSLTPVHHTGIPHFTKTKNLRITNDELELKLKLVIPACALYLGNYGIANNILHHVN